MENETGTKKYHPEWFAGRLRELRLRARLTQADLAKLAGVSQQTVAGAETGTYPRWDIVCALCGALGVSLDGIAEKPSEKAVEPIDRWAKRRGADGEQ